METDNFLSFRVSGVIVCTTVTNRVLAAASCLATVEDKSNHKNSNWTKKLCYK